MLLFSGYRNGGSWDLFLTTQDTVSGLWRTPVNLGPSVNSTTVDLNPSLSADGRTLYFVSFRAGGSGNSDIWQVPIAPVTDFNGDGRIDDADVTVLMENWGQDEPLCDIGPTPFGDGVVDMKDLAALAESSARELVDPTLLACWAFDEAEGEVACDDTATCDGVLIGDPVWRPGEGVSGGAIELDGVDDYIAASSGVDPAVGPMSVFAWVQGGRPGQVVLSQDGGDNWLVLGDGGMLKTDLRSANRFTKTLSSQAVITDGNWHRIGLVWDGVSRTLYVDDEPVVADTQNGLQSCRGAMNIGSGKDLAAGSFWSGLIDDVRIYSRVIRP